jgi:hypothetical protein
MHLLKAEDTAYSYLADADWDSNKAVDAVANEQYAHQPLLKFRGHERPAAEVKLL